jgi:hypothetical protein
MKIFSKEEFVRFVRSNDELYIENYGVDSEYDNFDYDMKVVNDVFDGNGFYSLMFGSRGEVEFRKVNFVEDIIEWNNIDDDYEFKFLRDDIVDYLDLGFDEEDFRCYFNIVEGK